MKSPLDGVDNGSCSAGGVIIVNNQCLYYCKSNELEGYLSKRSCKPVNPKSEIPEWVKDTEGSCQYYSKKRSDLEKHLYGMHRTKYLNHCFRCTHCDFVAVDRIRAKTHMNSCENLLNWAVQSDSFYPIHPMFLSKYKFWTSDKLVAFCRSKNDPIKNNKDVTREEVLKEYSKIASLHLLRKTYRQPQQKPFQNTHRLKMFHKLLLKCVTLFLMHQM